MSKHPKMMVSLEFDDNPVDQEMPDREVQINVDVNDKTSSNYSFITFMANNSYYVKFTKEEFEKIIDLYKKTIDIRI